MQPVPQDLLKEYVQSQHFTSTTEIMEAMKEMFRDVIQTVMEVEMDEELGRERCERSGEPEGTPRNYRNGYTKKTVKTQLGEVDIKVPRDRNGSFEPKIIGKYDRNADGMEDKILALYACGMSQRDIAEQIKELYGVEISPELVTKISEKDHAGGHSLAESLSGAGVSICVHGRHSLQGSGRPSVRDQSSVCGSGCHHGWQEGHSGSLDWRARKQQILAECAE